MEGVYVICQSIRVVRGRHTYVEAFLWVHFSVYYLMVIIIFHIGVRVSDEYVMKERGFCKSCAQQPTTREVPIYGYRPPRYPSSQPVRQYEYTYKLNFGTRITEMNTSKLRTLKCQPYLMFEFLSSYGNQLVCTPNHTAQYTTLMHSTASIVNMTLKR